MKLCSKCKTAERFSDYNSYCRPCKNEIDYKSHQKNFKKRSKYQKEYLDKNPEKKIKVRNQTKQWLKDNPNYVSKWMKDKYNTDPIYYLKSILLSSLNQSLKSKKTQNTIWFLGCNIEELKNHLESQFDSKMNWGNKGKFGWHVDHIKPLNTFDLSNPEELKQCWHYSNLRPLWWNENLSRPKNGDDSLDI
jgi:5-methylcytosine-specific restriction endonuclease McrA